MADNMTLPEITGHAKSAIFHTFWDHPILTQEANKNIWANVWYRLQKTRKKHICKLAKKGSRDSHAWSTALITSILAHKLVE